MNTVRNKSTAPSSTAGYRLGTSFQPVLSAADGRLCGHEALARPLDRNGHAVHPADLFFSIREEGELVRLDRDCRRAHLARFAAMQSGEGLLFLNVHPVAALADRLVPLDVLEMNLAHGLSPARVCVEILECECGDEVALAEAAAAYRALGMRLAIDDFGLVRSNFDRVAALRPDFVKIDRSLLGEAMGSARTLRMLPSLVSLLHEAGTRVVVEGIQEAQEALCAIEAGADFLQGDYLASPGPGLATDAGIGRLLGELRRQKATETGVPGATPSAMSG